MAAQDEQSSFIGVDVGGTKVETARVDENGTVVDSERHPTKSDKGPERVLRDIVTAVQKLLERADSVPALGMGIAGQIDRRKGVLLTSPNLHWRNVELKAPLEAALGLDVLVTNDVAAATWGEWKFGAGRGEDDLVCVFVGTGVGAGVVTDGRILEGSGTSASELGHVPLVFDGRDCSCRHRGCLEAYVGGWAIAERAREKVRQDFAAGNTLVSLAGSKDEITAKHVSDAFREKDPLAIELVKETGRYLSAASVGMVNTFNPSVLVLGGGVVEGLPELAGDVGEAVRVHAFSAFTERFRVAPAQLGGDAGVIGAAALARSHIGGRHE